MEEGIVMMVFYFSLLIILLPVIVWSVASRWHMVRMAGRLALVAASLTLLAATVIVPEVALKGMESIRPNHTSDGIRQPAGGLPKPSR